MFTKNDLFQFLTWLLFTLVQIQNIRYDQLQYYKQNRNHWLHFPFWWFGIIFPLTYGSIMFSIYLFVRWSTDISHWSYFTVPIVYIVLMLFDKFWFYILFSWKHSFALITCTWIQFLLSLVYIICTSLSGNLNTLPWLPPILGIPFSLLMVYLLAFSYTWKRRKETNVNTRAGI